MEVKVEKKMKHSFEDELIEAVKMHNVLYERTHRQYFDVPYKNKLWNEIAADLNQDSNECRKRWRHMRETFVKKYRSTKTGKTAEGTSWPYYNSMMFLKDHVTSRKSKAETVSADATNLVSNCIIEPVDMKFFDTEIISDELFSRPPPPKTKKTAEMTLNAIEAAANAVMRRVKDRDTHGTDTNFLIAKTLVALLNEIPERHRDAARAELFQNVFELKAKYRNTD